MKFFDSKYGKLIKMIFLLIILVLGYVFLFNLIIGINFIENFDLNEINKSVGKSSQVIFSNFSNNKMFIPKIIPNYSDESFLSITLINNNSRFIYLTCENSSLVITNNSIICEVGK